MPQESNNHDQTKESELGSFGKSVLVFLATPLIYYFWLVLIDNAPAITVDLTILSTETILFIVGFWAVSIIYFILAFVLLYTPLFKYNRAQTNLNTGRANNLIFSAVFSVFFCLASWYWHRFIFESKTFTQAVAGIITFSGLILGVFGVIQFWFSVIALQIVMWIKSHKA